jgi:ferrous-iron efflux pump FieF
MVATTNGTEAGSRLTPEQSGRLMRLATYAAVSVAGVLIVVKFAAWLATDSVSLLSTLIDSMIDAGASLINLYAVRQSLRPADREHRFGHGKAEPLAGLAQAAFISGSAGFLVFEAAKRLVHPHPVSHGGWGISVMVFAIVLTTALVLFQMMVVRRTGSVAIAADSIHYRTDILVNAGVLVALVLSSYLGLVWADPAVAILVAGYILWSAWRIGRQSLDFIMDHELPDEDRRRIRQIALSHPGVREMHDLRSRASGMQMFIQFHLEMDGGLTLLQAHEIAEQVMYEVENAFPSAEVFIHQDPEGIVERRATFD